MQTKSVFPTLAVLGVALSGCLSQSVAPTAHSNRDASSAAAQGGRAATTGTVYVTSQGLYYDTFVTVDPLPMEGEFQQIENMQTEFGPGDAGYLGGRWWEDTNGNDIQDPDDHYFQCPLLGPGRTSP